MKNILIVGDSTSSSLGGLSKNWLNKIKSGATWNEKIRFIDTCAPGVTASSAVVIIIKQLISLRLSVFMIILSIGNCDRIDRPYVSNKISFKKLFAILIKFLFKITKRKKMDWVKLDLTKWDSTLPNQSKQKIKNFYKSLKFIKYLAQFFGIKLIVIIPRSNLYFPPSTAKNNSLFYRIIDHDINLESLPIGVLPDLEKVKLISIQDDSQVTHIDLKSMLLVVKTYERQQIICAINNLAVKKFYEGQSQVAIQILNQLLCDRQTPSEYIYFNLAKIYQAEGSSAKALEYFIKSLDADTFSYRINSTYRETLERVFVHTNNVNIVDLYESVYDNYFLDHCHLLPQGQNLISNLVCDYISNYIEKGGFSPSLQIFPSNPELCEGDLRPFDEVFGIRSKVSIDTYLLQGRAHSLDLLVNFFEADLLKCKYPDIIESLIFYTLTEQELKTNSEYLNQTMIRERLRVKNLIDQLGLNVPKIIKPLKSPELIDKWLSQCFFNLNREIQEFIDKEISCSYRMRTIMHWYFRESLYFGFNSSYEMLYSRNSIRRWKEVIYIAIHLNQYQIIKIDEKIMKYFEFIGLLESLLSDSYTNLDFFGFGQSNIYTLELNIRKKSREIWESCFG
jgi:hypothetical protein